MGGAAAFFDLDRTLLDGSSSNDLNLALVKAGLVPERRLPGMGLLGRLYDTFGETLPVMALARAAALAARGWSANVAREAAEQAAERLVTRVAPYARPLIAQHRAAGRVVVVATTTPEHLVQPLAERLEIDDVIATRYAVADGRFTGRLDGGFVWSFGKLRAVQHWALERGIDLSESYAYSDSVYDVPLLRAVGHPFAVNPDPRLRVAALAQRWPMLWLDVPPDVPKFAGLEPFDVVRFLVRPQTIPYARFDISGVENIPAGGAGIVVANHRSYFDTIVIGLTVAAAGRPVRFLGKKEVFDAPVIGALAKAMGGIRVDRGSGSSRPLREAERALGSGELVALMPQGTIPRGHGFFDVRLTGRFGAARLAQATGAPIIPIGLWGTEHVWPRSSRLPNITNVVHPPLVQARVGPPVEGTGGGAPEGGTNAAASTGSASTGAASTGAASTGAASTGLESATERIMDAIMALLPPEARRHHEPTPEELARTYPPGQAPRVRSAGATG